MLKPRDLCQSSGTKTFLDAMHGGKVHLARFVLDALDRKIINSRTEQGRTPLMFAACLPEPDMRLKFIRLLLDNGAEVNGQDESGRTALSQACERGHLEAVKLLVQFNADPEIPDQAGNNALMYAASCGQSAVLDYLLKSFKRLGLRVDRTNQAGQSALQVATALGHGACVQVLSGRQRGARLQAEAGPCAEAPRSPRAASRAGGVWSPRPLSRQVMERFTRQFRPRTPPSLPRARHLWESPERGRAGNRSLAPAGEREGRSLREGRKAQSKGRNSWLFSRSSSCSPRGRGAEKGHRWTSQDPGEQHICPHSMTDEGPPEPSPPRLHPTSAQQPRRGTCEEWDYASPRIVIETRVISKSHETLLRAESWDWADSVRPPSTGTPHHPAEPTEGEEDSSAGRRLLRRFTSPEFQGLPVGGLASKSEDSTFLLSSVQQNARKATPPPGSVSKGNRSPLFMSRSRRQPLVM
ncbi:ankyrin repeat domain-containing protein 63 [Ambystoma mexicanum]|uniref:ankyrin repeat domain-containing protein 63 n=1 Tax=Ambystoma mexicanum TaxID=8296 RepID=UPI0037E750D8